MGVVKTVVVHDGLASGGAKERETERGRAEGEVDGGWCCLMVVEAEGRWWSGTGDWEREEGGAARGWWWSRVSAFHVRNASP